MALKRKIRSLKRRKSSSKPEAYKPDMYPSFYIYSSDGVILDFSSKDIGKSFNAKIKLTGINKRTKAGKDQTDYTFEVNSIEE